MTSQYVQYPYYTGPPIYATSSLFPTIQVDGQMVVAADTDDVYIYNLATKTYLLVGGPFFNPEIFLLKANNLSDVANALTSFNNISGMTTLGDLIYGGAGGSRDRIGIGSDGEVLTVVDGLPLWASALTIGPIDSQPPSSNGGVIYENTLVFQSASTSFSGLVNLTTQSFAGNKTFTGNISAANLSGTNTGDVTLGTANGLSIATGQILSLALSSTSTTGALDSTDWNTFNGKQAAGNYITALTGDVSATGPGSVSATIGANVVSNSKLATMAADTIKGNNTGSTGNAIDLTVAQLNAILPVFTSLLNGLTPLSGGGTTNFLRADGSWAVPTAGSGTVTSVGMTVPAFLSVSGSPITSSGTLGVTLSGTALPIANGGTGQTSALAAFNALSPLTNSGDILYGGTSGSGTRLAIGSTGNVLTISGGIPSWAPPATSGTVTSVGMTVPAFLSVSGSPITTSGTLGVTLSGTALPILNGGTGVTSVTTTPTATTFAGWDANKNLSSNSFINGYTTTVSSSSAVTLTVGSTELQFFTGSANQVLKLPVANTLVLGQQFIVFNNSTGTLTVESSGGNTIGTVMAASTNATYTCILTSGTTAASWFGDYTINGAQLSSASVVNSALAVMNADTIKGNDTGSSASPTDLTGTQVTSMLNTFTPSLQGLASASGGGTVNFLRADGNWAIPLQFQYVNGQLNSTAINALASNPSQVIAAPGAGLGIVVFMAMVKITPGSSAFTSGGDLVLQYTSTASITQRASGIIMPTSSVTGASGSTGYNSGPGTIGALGNSTNWWPFNLVAAADVSNGSVCMTTTNNTNFATGNGSLNYYIFYAVVTL